MGSILRSAGAPQQITNTFPTRCFHACSACFELVPVFAVRSRISERGKRGMTQITRQLMVGLMMTGLVCGARPTRADDVDGETIKHVRSSNASIVALISLAGQQSKTFRGLTETIDASSGIVYVETGQCGRAVQACLVSVTTDGRGHRFLQ